MSEKHSHVDDLRKKYDQLAEEVHATAPNTPERHAAMEAKKKAFAEWSVANDAKVKSDAAADIAAQKEAAAKGAGVEAAEAKKAAEAALHPPKSQLGTVKASTTPMAGGAHEKK